MCDSGQANSGRNGIRCARLEFELFHMLLSGDAARESKGCAEGQENHPRLIRFRLCLLRLGSSSILVPRHERLGKSQS